MGFAYFYGRGVAANPNEGIKFYLKSLEKGNTYAHNNLASAYLKGVCINKNLEKARKLFKVSADLGNYYSQYNISSMYGAGEEAAKKPNLELLYLLLSAENGYSES